MSDQLQCTTQSFLRSDPEDVFWLSDQSSCFCFCRHYSSNTEHSKTNPEVNVANDHHTFISEQHTNDQWAAAKLNPPTSERRRCLPRSRHARITARDHHRTHLYYTLHYRATISVIMLLLSLSLILRWSSKRKEISIGTKLSFTAKPAAILVFTQKRYEK